MLSYLDQLKDYAVTKRVKLLDAAVAAAHGWSADINDEDVLTRLFVLNQARSK